jgi:hypothetical protein
MGAADNVGAAFADHLSADGRWRAEVEGYDGVPLGVDWYVRVCRRDDDGRGPQD